MSSLEASISIYDNQHGRELPIWSPAKNSISYQWKKEEWKEMFSQVLKILSKFENISQVSFTYKMPYHSLKSPPIFHSTPFSLKFGHSCILHSWPPPTNSSTEIPSPFKNTFIIQTLFSFYSFMVLPLGFNSQFLDAWLFNCHSDTLFVSCF